MKKKILLFFCLFCFFGTTPIVKANIITSAVDNHRELSRAVSVVAAKTGFTYLVEIKDFSTVENLYFVPMSRNQFDDLYSGLYDYATSTYSKGVRTQTYDNGTVVTTINSDGTATVTSTVHGSTPEVKTFRAYTYNQYLAAFGAKNSQSDTQANIIRQSAALTNKIISTRILNTFSPKPQKIESLTAGNTAIPYAEAERGMASGGSMEDVGLWGMGAYSTSAISQTGQKSNGNVSLLLVGVDKIFMSNRLLAGVALGYENTWSKLKDFGVKTSGNGVAINPYVAYRVTDQFLIKGSAGFTYSDYSQSAGEKFNGMRWLGDLGAEYTWLKDAWLFTAELGTSYVTENFDNNYEDVYIWSGRIGGRVGYAVNEHALPYVRVAYNQDFDSSTSGDIGNQDLETAIGANIYKNNWTTSLEGFGNFFRTNQTTYGGSLLVRYDF